MSVDTVMHEAEVDPAGAQELMRTMAAIVRTVFGVALQAPSDGPEEQPVAPVEAAPLGVALPVETPTLVAVPAAISVELPLTVQQPPVALAAVPDAQPAAPTATPSIAMPSIPMPSISLEDSAWTLPQEPATTEADVAHETAARPLPDGFGTGLPLPAYAAPATPEAPSSGGHSLALLHEIAFLDD